MLRSQLFRHIYTGFVGVILVCTLIVGLSISRQITDNSMDEIQETLAARSELLAEISFSALLPQASRSTLIDLQQSITKLAASTHSRFTVIRADGTVIADSREDPEKMDNHAERPEIVEARLSGSGSARRYSDTAQQPMLYRALSVRNHTTLTGFVRVSFPLTMIDSKLAKLRSIVLLGAGLAALVALLLSFAFSKRFSNRIRQMTEAAESISMGDYDKRIHFTERDEIGQLADAFNRMASSSASRIKEMAAERHRLEKIFSGMVEGVIHVDQEQTIVYLNQAAADLLGISMTLCINRPIWEKVAVREILQALEKACDNSNGVKTRMCNKIHNDNTVIDIYAAAIRNDDGTPNGAVIVLHDISEIHRLLQVRRDFVANASHELKTPITAILGLTETILDDEEMDPGTRHVFMQKINAQSLRLSSLVSDLISLSRLESVHDPATHQTANLSEVILQSAAAGMAICLEKQLTLKTDIPSATINVEGEVQMISQLIDNLLTNAIKYTSSGGTIEITLDREETNAKVTVKDTGIGIGPEHQQRVFERFYRVDKARSRDVGGTGLGLSIVKNIVEQLGGTIYLESQPDIGSSFFVTLPLADHLH
ncbi:MAG: hypothetical protein CSA52_01060 [Gammaproteobacteria bacterium]|nr:MAG: hypothetical protein CSB48_12970 [Pseudomonadota bacterium]PIE38771.1 MAG: hypothetical protein CSA52_01060 [Gammaproteobacteria bacterium]